MLVSVLGLGIGGGAVRVADELTETRIGYFFIGNASDTEQTIEIVIERDGTAMFWETYTLSPESVVEPDGFEMAGDYVFHARTGDETQSFRPASGERIVGVQITRSRGLHLDDQPYSTEPRENDTFGTSR